MRTDEMEKSELRCIAIGLPVILADEAVFFSDAQRQECHSDFALDGVWNEVYLFRLDLAGGFAVRPSLIPPSVLSSADY